jgi:hypothetical protein
MMSPRRWLRLQRDRLAGDPYERTLAAAAADSPQRLLFFWNRGLGDIALGLVPMFQRARERLPHARIEVVTRTDLEEAFQLTDVDAVHVAPRLVRDDALTLAYACAKLPDDPRDGALVFDNPDPNRWLATAPRRFVPRLRWDPAFDALAPGVAGEGVCIAVHVASETASHYGYTKDWPAERFRQLFAAAADAHAARFVLLGHEAREPFATSNVVDLRGRTRFIEALALVRTRCAALLAPDSGILNGVYWLDAQFAIRVVSLWADPRLGLMRAKAASPNRCLVHVPLVGAARNVSNVTVDRVMAALGPALGASR